MKILYVKNTSDRDKKFQLQTMIYEEDGKKLVKKSALCDEALPHLYNMKENYIKLSNSIINPKVKLAKIVDSDDRSLTFEFIEGESLAKQFNQIKNDQDQVNIFIEKYISFLKDSFKTISFDSKNINLNFKKLFGDFDYSTLDGEICFDGISNIDLIFSNIIHKNDESYIIDYEWVFDFDAPISYILYRLLQNRSKKLHADMESSFINKYVYEKSFHKYSSNYTKSKFTIKQKIEIKENELHCIKENEVHSIKEYVQIKEREIQEQQQQLRRKEDEIQKLLEYNHELSKLTIYVRIKNRVKNLFKMEQL